MSYTGATIPRGLGDLKVAPMTGDTPGTNVDVPGIRTLSYNVEADSDELEGDNAIIAVVRNAAKLSGSMELGSVSLPALAAILGGTATSSGTTPNRILTYNQTNAASTYYFQVTGQAAAADGGAYRVVLKKVIAISGPDESLSVNSWNTPTLDFEGSGVGGVLLVRSAYETEVAIV